MPAKKPSPPSSAPTQTPPGTLLPAPTRRQRVLFGVALAAMILWLAALAVLATK